MEAGQVSGSLVWLAMGLGYAWTVRKLGRMGRAPRPMVPTISIEEPPVRPEAVEVGHPQAVESYRRA